MLHTTEVIKPVKYEPQSHVDTHVHKITESDLTFTVTRLHHTTHSRDTLLHRAATRNALEGRTRTPRSDKKRTRSTYSYTAQRQETHSYTT